jgi:hypothetical protein
LGESTVAAYTSEDATIAPIMNDVFNLKFTAASFICF